MSSSLTAALVSAPTAGLVLSLMVRRRRIWARVSVDDDEVTRVDLGGLTKTDRSGWGSEFDELRDRLVSAATVTPVLPGEADTGHTSTSRGTAADAARKDDTR